MKKVELLSPAGSLEAAKAAINAGADAIYIGGSKFGARAFAKNPEEDDLITTIEYAHLHGRKVFLTLNTLLKENEINKELYSFLKPYYEAGLDGVIVQDMGVFSFIKKYFPLLPVHTSTQMTVCDISAAKKLVEAGAERVVLARELSLDEVREITGAGIETECFIHGALCYCYSGQCLMSSIFGGRSGNRGRCAQPCRLPYTINKQKKHLISPKDLCGIEILPELIESGIYSFKIEGRMKRAEYTAAVTSVYRKYIDMYLENPGGEFRVSKEDMNILLNAGNRSGFTKGYYLQHNGRKMMSVDKPDYNIGSEEFFKEFQEKYLNTELKVKVKGHIILHKNEQAVFELSVGEHKVRCMGDYVQEAQKAPLTDEKVLKQLNKTGGSGFEFDHIGGEIDPDIFLPVNELNRLRRDGLDMIREAILSQYRREPAADVIKPLNNPSDNINEEISSFSIKDNKELSNKAYYVYLEEACQLKPVLDEGAVSRLYMASGCFKDIFDESELIAKAEIITKAGKEGFIAFPYVFRRDTRERFLKILPVIEKYYKGILIKTLDELAFLTENDYQGQIVGDYSLYSYNRYAGKWFLKNGATALCAPLELNSKELKSMASIYSEMLIYGHIPLMISAQCVHNTINGCDKKNARVSFSDRYNKSMISKSFCQYCYSVIYNGAPLILSDKLDDLKKLGIEHYRLNFTNESEEEVKKIIKSYNMGSCPEGEFTRGHLQRGIE